MFKPINQVDTAKKADDFQAEGGEAPPQLTTLRDSVQDKLATYDPDIDSKAEFATKEAMSLGELFSRYSTWKDKLILVMGMIGSSLYGVALPAFCILLAAMMDGVGAQIDTDQLKDRALIMLYVGFGVWLFSGLQIALFSIFSERLAFNIRVNYFKRCLEQDAAFFDEHNPREMAAKIAKECAAIQRGAGEKIGTVFMAIVTFLSGFTIAFFWGWELTLILLGGLPVLMIAGGAYAAIAQRGKAKEMKVYAQSAGFADQALSAIKVVQAFGCELLEVKIYSKFLLQSRDFQRKASITNGVGTSVIWFLMLLLYCYTFYFGGRFIADQEDIPEEDRKYSGGSLMGIMFCVVMGAFYIGGVGSHISAIADAKVAGKLAFDVIDNQPKVDPNSKGSEVHPSDVKGQFKFKNVNFTYPSRPELQVLKNFSFDFEAGKTTALVGPSGSGKSTIIQLIERFYDPDTGSVEIDGADVRDFDLRSMRRMIGYVSQEPILFNASIKENMLFAKPDATDSEIEQALRDANAWDFISQKMGSEGIHAQVGGAGGKLSGGQKQRIAIARAFLKKPKVLLLDEATSALDKVNERAVQDAIDRYRKEHGNITIVVIAHRLSTIKDADKIVVMKYGQIVEVGTNDSLLQEFPDGVYANFCAKQGKPEEEQVTSTDPSAEKAKTLKDKLESAGDLTSSKVSQIVSKANALDAEYEDKLKQIKEANSQISPYEKLSPYTRPKAAVFFAVLTSFLNGATLPIFAVALSQMLGALTVPYEYYPYFFVEHEEDSVMYRVRKNVTYMSLIAVSGFTCSFLSKYSFGYLGANVTLEIRKVLYEKVLRKHAGWFDEKEHSTGILTSAMAQDTSIINGVSTDSLGPQVEGSFSMMVGIACGFYFCWQQSVVCILCSPGLIVGKVFANKLVKGFSSEMSEKMKDSDLLCGDAISNYKMVQSFGNEKLLVSKYESMTFKVMSGNVKTHMWTGVMYGLSQFGQYLVFAALFYAAGVIVENHKDDFDEDGKPKIDPTDVITALFAIFMAAQQAGSSSAQAPDMGRATAAAERIFNYLETPSLIDAVASNDEKEKVKISNIASIKGEVEFRDVWFRYPTRKEDFVLRGLNIKINPNEKVALVGESGCGKSTFVNLLMRFYDVDHGEVLLDGVNVKDYNLHDLRKAISLVMQEPIIFNYSILENILYGAPTASNQEVNDASQVANCSEFVQTNQTQQSADTQALIDTMTANEKALKHLIGADKYEEELGLLRKVQKQEVAKGEFKAIDGVIDHRGSELKAYQLASGFSTQCGINGGKLSGGQKQRVAIARTIIRKPKVLLLDEATSALDEDNQRKVQDALDNASESRTTIIIAHRMSTIQNCDKIFVLEDGRVVEEGQLSQLKQSGNGYFARLEKKN